MHLRTRLAAFAVAAGVAVGMTACAGGGSSGGSGPSADAKQTLLIWDTGLLAKVSKAGKPESNSFLHQAAANFTKAHPNVKVKIVEQGGSISANYAQFKAASIAGNGPDLHIQFTGGGTLSYSKYLLDLNSVLDKATLANFNGLDTVKKDYKTDGALLALPYGSGTYFTVWYKKDLLQKAGLDMSTPPKTWEDMLALAKQYHDKTGEDGFTVANLEGYVGAWVVAALAAGESGPTTFTDMYSGKTKITDAAMVSAYKTWSEFRKTGLINKNAGELSNGDADPAFFKGKGAFYFSGTWANDGMQKTLGKNVGYFFIPMKAGAKNPNVAAGGPQVAVSITKYAKHMAAAKEFMKYLAEPKTQDLYVQLGQSEASSNKKADTSVIKNPLLQQQATQLKDAAVVFPFDNVMPQSVNDLYYRLDATTFLGTTTPEAAVQQLQTQLDQSK
jgi:raffinose/stachyose/melibiose transport system substrate-binding protein